MPAVSKHLINQPQDLVVESLKGLVYSGQGIALDERHKVVYREPVPKDQVTLISGGGSGHEPAHAGFVGDGLLTAAVCGNVFASPTATQIRSAIDHVTSSKGTLIVVKNYTGDCLHFGLASEQYKASGSQLGDVRVLIVGDDVAVGRTQGGIVGRRGLAGTVLVYKIAAALAREGASLDEVEAIARDIAGSIATLGVGLEHCHVPGTEVHDSHLSGDELELGMGIHNESGFLKLKPIPTLTELTDKMFGMLTSITDEERSFLPFKHDGKDEVVLLVNNLGALSELELGGIANSALTWLEKKGITVRRALVGTYMTSLSMPGFSYTLLLLPRGASSSGANTDKILSLLDAPSTAPGWKAHSAAGPSLQTVKSSAPAPEVAESKNAGGLKPMDPKAFIDSIRNASQALIEAEPEITRQDQIAGDGDAGLTLKAGATGILKAINSGNLSGDDVIQTILTISSIVDEEMGGTSGGLYSIFFSGLAKGLRDASSQGDTVNLEIWSKASSDALETLYKYTRARPPSRTLVDPLSAFVAALPNGMEPAVKAAKDAAEFTKTLTAKAGRGAYVEQGALKDANVPDPGAWGVAVLVEGLTK